MTGSRISKVTPEIIKSGTAESRVTQVTPEIIRSGGAGSRVSKVTPEIIVSANSRSRVSSVRVEIIRPWAGATPTPVSGSAQLFPRSGGRATGVAGETLGGDLSGTTNAATVTGFRGRPVSATAPAIGEAYAWNGTAWVPTTVGSPAVAYQVWDPLIPDASPHALSHEFATTSLSQFTQVNIPDTGVTVDANTTAPGQLFMKLPSLAYRMRCLLEAIPAGDFTIHTGVNIEADDLDLGMCGIVLSNTNTTNTGNQEFAVNVAYPGTECARRLITWNLFGETASGAGEVYMQRAGGTFVWIRVRRVGSNYFWAWSGDPMGCSWHETAHNPAFTPSYFGLTSQWYGGGSNGLQATFPFFRYYANGAQLKTGGLRNVYA